MTYLGLAGLFLLPVVLLVLLTSLRRRLDRRWWTVTGLTLAVLLVLTVVFDSLMIHVDLFRFEESQLTGVRLLLAPVEDLAWPVAAAFLLPTLWQLLGPRRPAARAARQRDEEEHS